jgi:hypothetical protein
MTANKGRPTLPRPGEVLYLWRRSGADRFDSKPGCFIVAEVSVHGKVYLDSTSLASCILHPIYFYFNFRASPGIAMQYGR